LDGQDTLALMPTGGGKSLCFQTAAMAMDGLCLAVTPLIALMKDQVENLKSRKIKAAAIFSGMTQHEINVALDNCRYGGNKFLYLSPEQLCSERFRSSLTEFNINLLAIDEAHCISQWGYDFRPSYLRIAEVRELLPNVPIMALTATATPLVAKDIMQKLHFKSEHVLQRSFQRQNLIYVVRHTEDKYGELLKIAQGVSGSAIVYASTRRACVDAARFLQRQRIPADYYHAGLDSAERSKRQHDWKHGRIRIICATNAFGMGIDKPDVRWVAHLDMPDSIEEYYQQAGRAGRDEQRSYAILLHASGDDEHAQSRMAAAFPPIEEIKRIYQALGTYLEIPTGTGAGSSHDFNINDFCQRYNLNIISVFSAMQFLQSDGYIEFAQEVNLPPRAMMLATRDDLYRIQLGNPDLDIIIKAMLRAYGGIFSGYVRIDENLIARAAASGIKQTRMALLRLGKMEIISYLPPKKTAVLSFTLDRASERDFSISKENYHERRRTKSERMEAMLAYARSHDQCRSQQLTAYFGEENVPACGLCDICRQKKN
jgi:ATP-dependent DNA helicase RecQ